MEGIIIGWKTACVQLENHIQSMNTLEEVKAYLHEEANKHRELVDGKVDGKKENKNEEI